MTRDDIRALADQFFEWPDASDKRVVTLTSAVLFAQYVLEMHANAQMDADSAFVPSLQEAK